MSTLIPKYDLHNSITLSPFTVITCVVTEAALVLRACMRACVRSGGCGGCRGGDCTTAVDVAELAGGCETGSGVADQGRLFELLQ